LWTTRWQAIESRLFTLESILKEAGPVIRGSDFDRWDLSIPGGLFGNVGVTAMVEEHGDGKQLCRFRSRPNSPNVVIAIFLGLMTAAGLAVVGHAAVAGGLLALTGSMVGLLIYKDCALAMRQWRDAIECYLRRDDTLCMLPKALPRWAGK
jgi:hypothetical protein